MRLLPPPDDPLEAFPEWTAELREAVTTGVDALRAAETAERAASAAAAASLAAGISAGAVTGGTTMTSASMTGATMTGGTAAIGSGVAAGAAGSAGFAAKLAALVLASATVTGGLAATGNLPDTVQAMVADAVAPIGIELPHPAGTILEVVETPSGTVSVGLEGSAIGVVDIEELPGWTGRVTSRDAANLTVTFENADRVVTVYASVDAAGEIATSVLDDAKRDLPALIPEIPAAGPAASLDARAVAGGLSAGLDGSVAVELD